jgi:DNA-binding HxlR family transcriptional regulator
MWQETAATLRVVGHPDRIWVLLELLRHGPARTGALVARTPLAQPDLSAHLRKLAERGLIGQPGNQQTPYALLDEHATVDLLRAAAEVTATRYNDPSAGALAHELRKRRHAVVPP